VTIEAVLVAARWLHLAAILLLFGIAAFPLYAPTGVDAWPEFQSWLRRRILGAALVGLAGGALWFAFSAADMSGNLGDAADPAALAAVVTDTAFGKLWLARLLGCAGLALAAWTPPLRPTIAPLAAVVLASLAGTGHAGLPEGWLGGVHRVADAIHLLAAGAWFGALWALGWLVTHRGQAPETAASLRRFSGVGQLAVAALLLTGVVNAYALLGGPDRLLATRYGRLLDVKLAAFAAMLVLAALNRFVLTPRLARGAAAEVLRRLRWQIGGEQLFSFAVVAVVAVIGTLDPNA